MPTEAVVDSSVVSALVTLEESSEWAQARMREYEYLHILDLNYYEVAEAIRHKVSDRLSVKDAMKAFTEAAELMSLYTIHSFSEVIADAMAVALELKITVYDAAFLALADKFGMRLLTLDVKLAKKLESTRYSRVIEFPGM